MKVIFLILIIISFNKSFINNLINKKIKNSNWSELLW